MPTSKSHAQRALCLNAFAPRGTEVLDLPPARDVAVLVAALESWRADPGRTLFLRDNGTGTRILSVLLPILNGSCRLDGTPRLRERPLTASEDFLTRYGGTASASWPRAFSGIGVDWPQEVVVDARVTTQVATGVLLGAGLRFAKARSGEGPIGPVRVQIEQPAAGGYLGVTTDLLGQFGIHTTQSQSGGNWTVDFLSYAPEEVPVTLSIPPDPSSFSFYAGMLVAHGHPVPRPDGGARVDSHPDWAVCDDLQRLGEGDGEGEVEILDLGSRPDTFPCLAALAALRPGGATLAGAAALRHKESDRIAAMAAVLQSLGARCAELPDGLRILRPIQDSGREVRVPAPDDHRIVMAAAILGTRVTSGIALDQPDAVAKSWPGFFDWLSSFGCVRDGG